MVKLEKALEDAIESALRERGEHTSVLVERISIREEPMETMGAGPRRSGKGYMVIELATFNPSA